MSEQYKTFPIKGCDLEQDVRIEVSTGEAADVPACSSLTRDGCSHLPNLEVTMRRNQAVKVSCLEFGNCDYCRRRV